MKPLAVLIVHSPGWFGLLLSSPWRCWPCSGRPVLASPVLLLFRRRPWSMALGPLLHRRSPASSGWSGSPDPLGRGLGQALLHRGPWEVDFLAKKSNNAITTTVLPPNLVSKGWGKAHPDNINSAQKCPTIYLWGPSLLPFSLLDLVWLKDNPRLS